MQQVFSLLGMDRPAVLISRVVGLLRRKGHRVASISMGKTTVPGLIRLIAVVETPPGQVELACLQAEKLPEIVAASALPAGEHWLRELALVRLAAADDHRPELLALLRQFGARLLDTAGETIVAELSEEPDTLDRMLIDLGRYRILDAARSSPTPLPRKAAPPAPPGLFASPAFQPSPGDTSSCGPEGTA